MSQRLRETRALMLNRSCMTSSYLEREDVADLREGDHGDGAEEGDHAQRGRRNPTNVDALEHQYHRYK